MRDYVQDMDDATDSQGITPPHRRNMGLGASYPRESLELKKILEELSWWHSGNNNKTVISPELAAAQITALHDAEIEYVIGPDLVTGKRGTPEYTRKYVVDLQNYEKEQARQRYQERRK